jgi:hypothetical protein
MAKNASLEAFKRTVLQKYNEVKQAIDLLLAEIPRQGRLEEKIVMAKSLESALMHLMGTLSDRDKPG